MKINEHFQYLYYSWRHGGLHSCTYNSILFVLHEKQIHIPYMPNILYTYIMLYQFLGVILSTPYMDLKFDTKAVQNWQGFWFSLITNSIFQYCYTSVITYQTEFPVVHREVSNNIYALSVYYISQIIITVCVKNYNYVQRF